MGIAETLQLEFESTFLSDDEMSEAIVYTPAGGAPKNIRAVVYRRGLRSSTQRFGQGSGSSQIEYQVEIRISSSSENGMPLVVVGDTISVPIKIGATAQTMVVSAITDQDPGTWRLGLRA